MRKIDITGHRFGRLVAIGLAGGRVGKERAWNCRCDCGNIVRTCMSNLKRGNTKSCGCYLAEKTAEMGRNCATHGLSQVPIYNSWSNMIKRCYNPENNSFSIYGARGISVCEFLRASPSNLKFLIGDKPAGFSIERINNNGNYSCGQCAECLTNQWPKNVKWATATEQGRNKRNNVKIEIEGSVKCASEWAEISMIDPDTMLRRIGLGWTGIRLLSPVQKHSKN